MKIEDIPVVTSNSLPKGIEGMLVKHNHKVMVYAGGQWIKVEGRHCICDHDVESHSINEECNVSCNTPECICRHFDTEKLRWVAKHAK